MGNKLYISDLIKKGKINYAKEILNRRSTKNIR